MLYQISIICYLSGSHIVQVSAFCYIIWQQSIKFVLVCHHNSLKIRDITFVTIVVTVMVFKLVGGGREKDSHIKRMGMFIVPVGAYMQCW